MKFQTKQVDLPELLLNSEIEIHLDKVQHPNPMRRWNHAKKGSTMPQRRSAPCLFDEESRKA